MSGQSESGPFSPPPDRYDSSLGEALAWLDRHINLEAIESGKAGRYSLPTLERISALESAMGDPHLSYPVIHITGTNGKGSTSRMATSLLIAAGINPGTFISPHLETINERLSVGGEAISDTELAQQLLSLAELEVFIGVKATWFELLTAAAFSWFADRAVEAGVIEVGLGGRWDATNVVDSAVSVVTNVELDHVAILGSTREAIAAEKAGIVKAGGWLVLGEEEPSVADVFLQAAERVGAAGVWRRGEDYGAEASRLALGGRVVDLYTPYGRYEDVFVPLFGAHQAANAACALAAVQAFLGAGLGEQVVADGFAAVRAPGRLEVVARAPTVLLDGAHNVAGAEAAGAALHEDFRPGPASSGRRVIVVMGCLRGREPLELLSALGPDQLSHVVACEAPSPRSLGADVVLEAARAVGLTGEDGGSVSDALDRARELARDGDLIFVTGSLYVAGEARALLAH
ncbi:MAG: bifunctional folylpolyglutamate synthase/dihydrofolate synthase [Acidimicrobiales bacterium]